MAKGGIIDGIMGALDGFKGSASASIHDFRPIDVEATARRIGIEQKAKKNGAADIPRSDSVDLDAVEQAIVGEVSSYAQTYYQDFIQDGKVYFDRITGANGLVQIEKMQTDAKAAIAEFETTANAGINDLHVARKKAIDEENGLADFRVEHRLKRPPMRTDENKVYAVGFVGILLLLEMILNGSFLSKGNQLGLLGGVLEALIIALVNIMIAGMVGRLVLPLVHHRRFLIMLFGGTIFVAYLALVVGFNLAVGHYRDALASDPFEGATLALRSLRADPLAIHDLTSWLLVLMGFLFSIFALLKFYWMDDPYPGYGDKYRAWREAAEDYNDIHADKIDELRELMEDTRVKLTDSMLQIEAGQNNLVSTIAAAAGKRAGFRKFADDCQQAGNLLLKMYRDANTATRKTPPPARFSDGGAWKLGGFDLDIYDFGKVDAAVVEQRIAEAHRVQREWVDRLIEAYTRAQKSIDAIGTILIPEKALNSPSNRSLPPTTPSQETPKPIDTATGAL